MQRTLSSDTRRHHRRSLGAERGWITDRKIMLAAAIVAIAIVVILWLTTSPDPAALAADWPPGSL